MCICDHDMSRHILLIRNINIRKNTTCNFPYYYFQFHTDTTNLMVIYRCIQKWIFKNDQVLHSHSGFESTFQCPTLTFNTFQNKSIHISISKQLSSFIFLQIYVCAALYT